MSGEMYRQAAEIFTAARTQTGADRAAFVERMCGDDDALREAVMDLLAHDVTEGFVPQEEGDHGARYLAGQLATEERAEDDATPAASEPNVPQQVGPYTITRLIAVGGMGAVYEARQGQPSRTVAVKVIRADLAAPSARARFEREAELLGQLQHPGITHVYEAGIAQVVSSGGEASEQPFIAMEFIRGRTLDAYARDHQLDTGRRLELIAKIAEAVHYAHQKGVIHRDLKPGNILVDESGAPKILDFGVARATNADMQAVTLQTDIGQLIGTLPYMSPEQAGGDSSRLDTRSDVYALGVVFFELLSGRLPIDLRQQSIPECARLIQEQEPTGLGTVDAGWRGDVATIAAKALEKDPARRYQSAAEFAADIHRHLRHEPIAARPASASYQLRKFARRNKTLVGGTAATALALVVGMIGTLRYAIGENRQRTTAEHNSRKATAVNEFLVGMLEEANPETNPFGREMTLPEVLDTAAAQIEPSFREQPDVEAGVRFTIGRAYTALGRPTDAVASLRRAVELQRARPEGDQSELAESLAALATALIQTGDWDAAHAAVDEAIALNRVVFGDEHESIVECLTLLGAVYSAEADYVRAEEHHRRALAAGRAILPDDHRLMSTIHKGLAETSFNLGNLDDAESHFRASARIDRVVRGEYHPVYAAGLVNLGVVLRNKGDLDGAEQMYNESMSILNRTLGEEHLTTVSLKSNLGRLLQEKNDYERAASLFTDVLAMRERILGDDHPMVSVSKRVLANNYVAWGRYTDAEPLLLEALAFDRAHLGLEHMHTRSALTDLATLYVLQDRDAEAEPLYVELVNGCRQSMPEDHWQIGGVEFGLGLCRLRLDRYDEAERSLLEAYRILDVAERPERVRVARTLVTLYDDWGRPESAAAWRGKLPDADPGP